MLGIRGSNEEQDLPPGEVRSEEDVNALFADDEEAPAPAPPQAPAPRVEEEDEEPQADRPPGVYDDNDVEEELEEALAAEGQQPDADDVTDQTPLPETVAAEFRNRFSTMEQLGQGYKAIQRGFTDVVSENRRLVAAQEEANQRVAQLEQLVQQMVLSQDPELAEQFQAEMARTQQIEQAVQQRVAPIEQQLQQQAQLQQRAAVEQRFDTAVRTFYENHPDIPPESPQDQEFTQTASRIAQVLKSSGVEVDLTNPQTYEVFYEAHSNPQFMAELFLAPQAFEIPEALARLRERAGATIARERQPGPSRQGTRPGSPPTARKRIEAHVEQPSGGAPGTPAPGQKPGDEFDEAMAWYDRRSARGPLFGGQGAS